MTAMTDAGRGEVELVGPTVTGFHVGTATATSGTAASLDLGIETGGCWVTFQARGADVYVRFGSDASTGTTAGNGSNGFKVVSDQRFDKWVTARERYCDHAASGAGTLFWWKSSPNYRNRP